VNRVRPIIATAAVTVLIVASGLAVRSDDTPAIGNAPEPLIAKPMPAPTMAQATGSVGCSATACHGGAVNGLVPRSGWAAGAADDQRWRSSATVWRCYDPHARAFDVLENELSKQIEARLARIDAVPLDARKDIRCLACHSNPTLANQPSHPLHAEGVNCESCHGNAGTWQSEHAGWQAGTMHQRALLRAEMTNLSDPAVRAETCAGCHVGAPATDRTPLRDMNHDLIAAGHPRLNFDYATYLRALPPHWAEKNRDVAPAVFRPPSDAYRHWLVGCAATNSARYRLLTDRAQRGPWPELAEFDCYACHRGLDAKSARSSGELIWNEPILNAKLSGSEFADIRTAMQRPADANAIKIAAEQSAEAWQRVANRWTTNPTPRALVVESLTDVKPSRWDQACHLYYALLAFDAADRRIPDPRLLEIRDTLRLPQAVEGMKLHSPRHFEPNRLPFADLFRERAR
jgi:Cytochrome c554 and c-prime